MEVYIVVLILLALAFGFINGFHDSANSTATVVFTHVLPPRYAVFWAAFFNFIAFLFFGLYVAGTVGRGIIDINIVDSRIILATLCGAIAWDLITWYLGLPTSSSHALIGGLIGAALVKAGSSSLVLEGIVKTVAFIFISPIMGFAIGIAIGTIVMWAFRRSTPGRVDFLFRKGQLVSAALYSLGHGGNDAQKTIGIIAGLLFSAGLLGESFSIPLWVILSSYGTIALGTLFGGWRIVKTMGDRIARLRPVDGFCAEGSAAVTIFIASFFGIPVSTTQTIAGAVMGVGFTRRLSAVRWRVAREILWAWILTIPASAAISALIYFIAARIKTGA